MKKILDYPFRIMIVLLVLFVAACGSDDDDNDNLSTADKLVGTWTTSSINIDASVGDQSLTDYLVDEVGLSAEDAAAQYGLFVAALQSEVTGSITLNADNTYETDFGNGTDSGTWSLSTDEETLTLTDGSDATEVTVNSVSGSTWNASIGDVITMDLDDDPGTPDEEVTVVANLTLTK